MLLFFSPEAVKSEMLFLLLSPCPSSSQSLGVVILAQSLDPCVLTWHQEDAGLLDSIFVLPLTVKAQDCFWLPSELDGAVGPGGSYGGRYLEGVTHVFQSHRNTSHKPLHDGCGDTIERAVALWLLLQGAHVMGQCGGYCGEGGPGVTEAP